MGMTEKETEYGIIKGITQVEFYEENSSIKACSVNVYQALDSDYGSLVPQYEDDGARRKDVKSLSFYANGKLKRLALNAQSQVLTEVGSYPAELLTFYESGRLKRIFPLDGKITGYWTEENEYALAKEVKLPLPSGEIEGKVIGLQFYEEGMFKSITFWPKEVIDISTPLGNRKIRIGLSFYKEGTVKSCEPAEPALVATSIGELLAYEADAIGVNGDISSLCFYEDGRVKSLITSKNSIKITDQNGEMQIFEPVFKPSLFDIEKKMLVPLKIQFENGNVKIGIRDEVAETVYKIEEYTFCVQPFTGGGCSSCSECDGCAG